MTLFLLFILYFIKNQHLIVISCKSFNVFIPKEWLKLICFSLICETAPGYDLWSSVISVVFLSTNLSKTFLKTSKLRFSTFHLVSFVFSSIKPINHCNPGLIRQTRKNSFNTLYKSHFSDLNFENIST